MTKMKKVLVCLDEQTIEKARSAGNGNLSAGLRYGIYDEHSIIVLGQGTDDVYVQIDRLAAKYPAKSPAFIRKLIGTAIAVREPIDRVIMRYLDGDKTVTVSQEMYAAYEEATREERA